MIEHRSAADGRFAAVIRPAARHRPKWPLSTGLSIRRVEPEMMDDPALGAEQHQHALRGLARLNRISRSDRILLPSILRLAAERRKWPLRVLDLATGVGDVPIAIARAARRRGVALEVAGCDVSARAVAYAQKHAAESGVAISLFEHDVLREPIADSYDVVMCSLFLHHLADEQAVLLLQRMRAASRSLVLVNDLRRSRVALAVTWLATRLLTRSRIVHVDGPRSVRAAFRIDEALALAERAGLTGARVTPLWPWRFRLEWRHP